MRMPEEATSDAKFLVMDSTDAEQTAEITLSVRGCRTLLLVMNTTAAFPAARRRGTAYSALFHA